VLSLGNQATSNAEGGSAWTDRNVWPVPKPMLVVRIEGPDNICREWRIGGRLARNGRRRAHEVEAAFIVPKTKNVYV
jgi:hypothetical protein